MQYLLSSSGIQCTMAMRCWWQTHVAGFSRWDIKTPSSYFIHWEDTQRQMMFHLVGACNSMKRFVDFFAFLELHHLSLFGFNWTCDIWTGPMVWWLELDLLTHVYFFRLFHQLWNFFMVWIQYSEWVFFSGVQFGELHTVIQLEAKYLSGVPSYDMCFEKLVRPIWCRLYDIVNLSVGFNNKGNWLVSKFFKKICIF